MFGPRVAKLKSVPCPPTTVAAHRLGPSAIGHAHLLERGVSNEAILGHPAQLGADSLERSAPEQEVAAPRASWDFSKISIFPPVREEPYQVPRLSIQAKLNVGAVDDPLEREADRVASQVMGMSQQDASLVTDRPQISRTGRADASKEKEKPQEKYAGPQTAAAGVVPDIVNGALSSPWQPLDSATLAYFEPRLGHDFSRVRVHTASKAVDSARGVQARAYTVGSDVVFDNGQFAPHTSEGKALLAHELTHVVQQSGGAVAIQRAPSPENKGRQTSGPRGPSQISTDIDYEALRKEAYEANAKRSGLALWLGESEDDYIRDFIREKLVNNLNERVADVKAQGQLFREVKQWRERFRAFNDALHEVAREATSTDLRAEFERVSSKFHIFEHERTPFVAQKLDRLALQGQDLERIAESSADAEYQYEIQADPVEQGLVDEGAAIIKELAKWSYAHDKSMSKRQYQAFGARITRWGDGVERLMRMELKAKADFTGSGPVSSPGGG